MDYSGSRGRSGLPRDGEPRQLGACRLARHRGLAGWRWQ